MTGLDPDRRTFLRRLGALGLGLVVGGLPSGGIAGSTRGTRLPSSGSSQALPTHGVGWTPDEVTRAFRAMGTILEVRIQGMREPDAVHAIGLVRRRVAELEAALTIFRDSAPLARLARTPEAQWVAAPRDLTAALELAGAAVARTESAFDPTVAPMIRAWGLYDVEFRRPNEDRWRSWRSRPGWDALEIDVRGSRIRRLDSRIEVDLGGIGKGIALDAAVSLLRDEGVASALINFGGSLGAVGPPVAPRLASEPARGTDRGGGWPVGIAHPRIPGEVWSQVELRSGFLTTSADSERFHLDPRGSRHHHILDPRSGNSVPGVVSVTLWSETAVEGDIASTASFVRTGRGEVGTGSQLALFESAHGGLEESGQGWTGVFG